MAYIPESGSVVAFQSDPTKLLTHSSVSGTVQTEGIQADAAAVTANPVLIGGKNTDGSVATASFALDGDMVTHMHSSIISLVDNAPNQVAIPRGEDDNSFMVQPAYGYMFDGSAWDRVKGNSTDGLFVNITGSVATTATPAANQSVSGTVGASVVGHAPVVIVGGSILTSSTPNQSVSGTVGASVIGTVPVTQSGLTISSISGYVTTTFLPGTADSFGHLVIGEMNNQLDIPFFQSAPSNLVTITTANGGGAISSVGGALFSSGTNVSGKSKGVTPGTVLYRAGSEVYAYFTTSFTTPTDANSHQRIGIYNDTDGAFIGYEGTAFKATLRTNSSDSGVEKGSWTHDQLTGAAGSKFTRNGSPEAIDFTKINVFRIRFGWLGSAPIEYEVLSPDGEWVLFHQLRIPNLQVIPSMESPNLPVTLDIDKTGSDATNLTMLTGCWGAGTTTNLAKISDPVSSSTLTQLTRAVITGESTAGGGGFVNVKVAPSGVLETAANQEGTWRVSIAGIIQASVHGAVSVAGGSLSVANFPTTQNVSGSVVASGTVTANQGTGFGSIAAHIKSGSVVAVLGGNTSVFAIQSGTRNTSIAGTVIVETISSVKVLLQPTSMTSGHGSVNGAASVQVLAAGGTGLRTYVTGIMIANTSSNISLISITNGDGSIMGKTIAPAGGGSNQSFLTPLKSGPNKVVNLSSETASSVIHGTYTGYYAP